MRENSDMTKGQDHVGGTNSTVTPVSNATNVLLTICSEVVSEIQASSKYCLEMFGQN